ncbi:hypothetical protein FRC11_013030, partial [Ceratobasidium sp. 423]
HGSQYTWCGTGAKQVAVVGKEEKHAYTLFIGVSNDGQLPPFQAIYQGSTSASLLHPTSPGYDDATQLGIHFELSMKKTYWSTLQTMKLYVIFILPVSTVSGRLMYGLSITLLSFGTGSQRTIPE